MQKPDPNSKLVEKIHSYLERANDIMDKLGHPFAHRVYQAITHSLIQAFTTARDGHFGQFQWRGFVYPEQELKSLLPSN